MHDRVPTPGRENRVKITQDDGTVISGVLAYDDQATQEGSAYTKGNVLTDDACTLLELDKQTAEPKDAFMILGLMQSTVYGRIIIKVNTSNSTLPISNIAITIGSSTYYTNSNGEVQVDLPPASYQVRLTNTIDLTFSPSSFSITATRGKITRRTVTCNTRSNQQITITTSQSIRFSDAVKEFDVFCVGGGGSGAMGCYAFRQRGTSSLVGIGCTGGAGGYTNSAFNIEYVQGKDISITIGSGGAASSYHAEGSLSDYGSIIQGYGGSTGGTTSVSFNGAVICQAAGGEGGKYGRQTTSAEWSCSVQGANGGSGSGAVAGDQRVGDSGGDGNDGEDATLFTTTYGGTGQGTTTKAFGESSGTAYSPAGGSVVVFNTYEYGVSANAGSVYSGGGQAKWDTLNDGETVAANSGTVAGAGGGGAYGSTSGSVLRANITVTSGAGRAGIAIIRWRYS